MRLLILFLLLLSTFSSQLQAQGPLPIDWVFVVDGYNTVSLEGLVVDDEGNTYAGIDYGMTLSIPELDLECPRAGHVSRLLIKLDPQGKALWVQPMTSAYDGRIEAMALTPEGDVLVSGFCDGKSTYTSSAGMDVVLGRDKGKGEYHQPQYLYIAKYSPEGKLIWAKVYEQSWGQVGGLAVNSKAISTGLSITAVRSWMAIKSLTISMGLPIKKTVFQFGKWIVKEVLWNGFQFDIRRKAESIQPN